MAQTKTATPDTKSKSRDKALEIIRSELNLEQWSIFRPSNSRNAPKARTLTREITLSDGSKATAQVEVGFTNKGELTTEDQKTLYALVKQWEDRGRPDEVTSFSLKRLARLLRKQWGTQTIKGLINSLSRLRATPFTWTNSYYDSSTDETVEMLEMFNILSDLRVAKRSKGEVITKELGYFKFHDLILTNIKNNHTKPILYEVAISFRSEIAQLLYNRLDRFLVEKTQYERRTKELFDDLGLEGRAYLNLSNRKQTLERAFKELVGKPLTTGSITSATLEPTSDKKDYKAVFRKGPRAAAIKTQSAITQTDNDKAELTPETPIDQAKGERELLTQGRELVKYFFQTFHQSQKFYILDKAVKQAVSLIAQYGYEQARYIVDFAKLHAHETGYQPQTFGGIVQYTARALAEIDEHQHRQLQRAKSEAEEAERRQLEDEHSEFCRQAVDAYIAEHAADLPAWIESKKQALLAESYSLYSQWADQTFTEFAQRAVRGDISRELGLPTFGNYYEQHRSRGEASTPQ
jgi:hypothetical protein